MHACMYEYMDVCMLICWNLFLYNYKDMNLRVYQKCERFDVCF